MTSNSCHALPSAHKIAKLALGVGSVTIFLYSASFWFLAGIRRPSVAAHTPQIPPRRIRIAVEEAAGHHEEVFGALIYGVSLLPGAEVDFYRKHPLRFTFNDTLFSFFPKPIIPLDDLYSDLTLQDDSHRIDILISTTCEVHLPNAGEKLMKIWATRQKKFKLLCLIHHADRVEKLEKHLRPWAVAGALSLVSLSSHVSTTTELNLGWLMAKPDGVLGVPYDQCSIHTFVPIFPYDPHLRKNSSSLAQRSGRNRVSRVAIQGNIDQGRRDYHTIIKTLESEILANPKLWGYMLAGDPVNLTAPVQKDPTIADPFTLHLIGQGKVDIPGLLTEVVQLHPGLTYPEFYRLLHTMDLLVPAFAGNGYYTNAASSSIPAAVIGHVPVLATRMHLNAYTYLDPRGVVLRPSSISDISAIALLRQRGSTMLKPSLEPHISGQHAALHFWPRSEIEMESHRASIYESNMRVLSRAILDDAHYY